MKKILFVLVVLLSLMSCNMMPSTLNNYEEINNFMIENNIDTEYKVFHFLRFNIDRDNYDLIGRCQTPIQTFTRKKGDCEDYVILAMYMLKQINIESYLVIVLLHGNFLNKYTHAVIEIDNILIEAQTGQWYQEPYEKVLKRVCL